MPAREVITIGTGQCGCNLALAFWNVLLQEHNLDTIREMCAHENAGDQHVENFFATHRIGNQDVYVPRAKFIDFDSNTLNTLKTMTNGSLFSKEDFLTNFDSSGSNFCKVFKDGKEFCETICSNSIRDTVENCDAFHGFQMMGALGGGMGSAMTCLLGELLEDEYPNCASISHSILPVENETNTSTYNLLMGVDKILDHVDQIVMYDNDQLTELCSRQLDSITLATLNYAITCVSAGFTCSMRWKSNLNTDFKKLAVNLIPFPRLRFYIPCFAPLVSPRFGIVAMKMPCNAKSLVRRSFMAECSMVRYRDHFAYDFKNLLDKQQLDKSKEAPDGIFLASNLTFRGDVSMHHGLETFHKFKTDNPTIFATWSPSCVKASITKRSSVNYKNCLINISNHTSIGEHFNTLNESFRTLSTKGAFSHQFLQYSHPDYLNEVYFNVKDLVSNYHDISRKHTPVE